MVNTQYAKAYKEVLEVLNNLNEDDYSKIPNEYIEFLEENSDADYEFEYDTEKAFEEQILLVDTKYILFHIFEQFGATEEQRKKIKRIKTTYYNKIEDEKREKYFPDDIFKLEKSDTSSKEERIEDTSNSGQALIKKKETIFDKIKKILRIH